MPRFLLILLSLLPLHAADKPTVLAVFAHPDDETTVGGLLAKYASEGHDVYIALTTSGQIGDANTDIPRGEKLGAAREDEARCSAKALGIHEPILFGFMDGDTWQPPVQRQIATRLRETIDKLKPETIITWGPDGLTGHPDHRSVCNVVTQVFLQRSQLSHHPKRLYYVAWPESAFENAPPPFNRPGFLRTVADSFVDTSIDVSAFADAAFRSMQCHKTQWSAERMEQNRLLGEKILGGKVHLRLALTE